MNRYLLAVAIAMVGGCGGTRAGQELGPGRDLWARLVRFMPDSGQVGELDSPETSVLFSDRLRKRLQQGTATDANVLSYRFSHRPSEYHPVAIELPARGSTGTLSVALAGGTEILLVPIAAEPGGAIVLDEGTVRRQGGG